MKSGILSIGGNVNFMSSERQKVSRSQHRVLNQWGVSRRKDGNRLGLRKRLLLLRQINGCKSVPVAAKGSTATAGLREQEATQEGREQR